MEQTECIIINLHIFYNAIQKYGWNNFKHIVLIKNLNNDEANIIENYLIGKYDTTNPLKGYNLKSGGKNDKHSDITKIKDIQGS